MSVLESERISICAVCGEPIEKGEAVQPFKEGFCHLRCWYELQEPSSVRESEDKSSKITH